MSIKNLALLLIFILTSSVGFADPVSAKLVSEHQLIEQEKPFNLIVEIKLEEGWHLYWKNPGDAGMAPQINWKLPEGIVVEEVRWPLPERFETEGAVTFGYSNSAFFYATLKATKSLPQNVEIKADIDWVACSSETCLPGSEEMSIPLKFGKESITDENAHAHFLEVCAHLPSKEAPSFHTENNKIIFELEGVDNEIALNETPLFFPEEGMIPKHHVTLQKGGGQVAIEKNSTTPLKGVLALGSKAWEIDLSDAQIPELPSTSSVEDITWGWALLFALVGGLILNLMPCVLPVVSLKIMSFVQMSNQSRREQLKHASLFSSGVIMSFLALAISLILLKMTGQAVGWGFQLQNPFVIACLAMLFALVGLNLFGVFEMGTNMAALIGKGPSKTSDKNYSTSFWNGVFATAVATPCTGPFMGSALGYALVQPAYVSLSIFFSLGLGMSLPYLLLGINPKLIRWIPKPGAWMESFKQFLGFLMLATVIWLLWVFSGQTSSEGLFLLLFALLLTALGAWVLGRWGNLSRPSLIRKVGYVVAAVCLGLSLWIAFSASQDEGHVSNMEIAEAGWEPFSLARLNELKEKKIPVLIDFTAKWCLICQTNHWVLSETKVQQALDAKNVVRMKADWTRHDPEITAELAKHGRSGVPLYVLYGQNHEMPQILPQVLTKEAVIQAIHTTVR